MGGAYNAATWLLDRIVADGNGRAIATVCRGSNMTYHEQLEQVWRAQNAARELDVRPGERVAFVLNDEPSMITWFLATMRSGAVAVPLSTMLTANELADIIEDSGAGTVVVSEQYAEHLSLIAERSSVLRAAVVVGMAPEFGGIPIYEWNAFKDCNEAPVASTKDDSPAFWLYTSGTTGSPKGAMHRHASLEATAMTYGRSVLQITPDDRCLSVAKMFFAYGLGNSLTFPFSVAATTILEPRRPTPRIMEELLVEQRPTLFFATPGFLAAMLDASVPRSVFESVRLVVTAGEALPAELHRRFTAAYPCPLLDGIGSTEALHIFLSNRVGEEKPGTSGTPVPGYEVKLLDDNDREVVEPDTPGYLHVRGPSTAIGYWSRREATQAAMRGEWLRTGDVYTRTGSGFFTFLGRNNDMIKSGGIWVSPAEVENVLLSHPDVLEAAVVGGQDSEGLETTIAFVVPRSGHRIEASSLESHCRDRMAAFKRPKRIIEMELLPKTPTGKIQRYVLRDSVTNC